jgi:DNA-binding transcriptional LysR family regulator
MDITSHAIDIGIRFGEPQDARFLCRKIASNRRFVCASPEYLGKHGMPAVPRDLLSHQCIVTRENATASSWHLTNGKQQETVKVRGQLSTNQGEIAMDWALAGRGVLLRSEWAMAPQLQTGELKRVLAPWVGPSADIHAVYHQRHHLSAKVRFFLDFLIERFSEQRPDGR